MELVINGQARQSSKLAPNFADGLVDSLQMKGDRVAIEQAALRTEQPMRAGDPD